MSNVIHMEMKRFNGSTYIISCPRTVIEQVVNYNQHDINTTVHVSEDDRRAFKTLAVLNENGYVNTKGALRNIAEYPTYNAFVAEMDTLVPNTMVMVLDATEDITVDSGWAMYVVHRDAHGTIPFKVSDNAMLDMSISLATVKGFNQDAESLDGLVRNSHTHDNVARLHSFTGDSLVKLQDIQQVHTKVETEMDSLVAKTSDMVFATTELKSK